MVANLNGAAGLRDVSYTNLHLASLSPTEASQLRATVQYVQMAADLVEIAVRNAEQRGQTRMSDSANQGADVKGAVTLAQLATAAPGAESFNWAGTSWTNSNCAAGEVNIVGALHAAKYSLVGGSVTDDTMNTALAALASKGVSLLATTWNAWQDPPSLAEFRQAIEEARTWAAREESKLAPGKGTAVAARETGGVQVHNGKWYVAGQEVTYDDVYFAVRVNQVANIDTNLNDYVSVIQKNNAKVKQANEFLTTLRTYKPTSTSATVSLSDLSKIRNSFSSLYGYDPSTRFDLKMTAAGGQTSFDSWIETVKSAISDLQSDNQTAQLKMERLNNQRSEVLEGLTSFTKGQSQTSASISRNVG